MHDSALTEMDILLGDSDNQYKSVYSEWEEWMGYTVHYLDWNNEGPFIDPATDYGVSCDAAERIMRHILSTGRCAWCVRKDPSEIEVVPF